MIFSNEYAKYYDIIYSDKNYSHECDFLEEIFERFSSIPVKRILDIGCGTGNHALELTKRGYSVLGIEASEDMAMIASEKGVNVILGNLPDDNPNISEKFDVVISMFTVVGYIHETDKLIKTFKWIRKHTKHLFIFDFWNGIAVLYQKPRSGVKIVGNVKRYKYPLLVPRKHIVRVHHEIYDNNKLVVTEDHSIRFYFPLEIEHYLEDAGFRLLGLYPCWNMKRDITENDWDVVAIAEVI